MDKQTSPLNKEDLQQQLPQPNPQIQPAFQLVRNQQPIMHNTNMNNIPIPVINLLQSMPKQVLHSNTAMNVIRSNISSPMSPLSLNVSPMCSVPSSPNSFSPAMSPAQREHVLSPYSTQSLSPVGKFQQYSPGSRLMSPVGALKGCDPYLTNKMQSSPGFPLQTPDIMLESSVPLATDFWTESDMLQGTSDLLTALDDVKLV